MEEINVERLLVDPAREIARVIGAENERERRREIIRQVIILALLGAGVIGSAIILFPNW